MDLQKLGQKTFSFLCQTVEAQVLDTTLFEEGMDRDWSKEPLHVISDLGQRQLRTISAPE